jgi:hypothetical protein
MMADKYILIYEEDSELSDKRKITYEFNDPQLAPAILVRFGTFLAAVGFSEKVIEKIEFEGQPINELNW